MIGRIAISVVSAALWTQSAEAQQTSTLCSFTAGPRAGSFQDYVGRPPAPVGMPCQDGQGSFGVVMPANDPSVAIQLPAPRAAQGAPTSTICRFTAGPRSGTSFDYAQFGVAPLPVGSPCHDGSSSTGTVDAGTAAASMSTICRFTRGPLAG